MEVFEFPHVSRGLHGLQSPFMSALSFPPPNSPVRGASRCYHDCQFFLIGKETGSEKESDLSKVIQLIGLEVRCV